MAGIGFYPDEGLENGGKAALSLQLLLLTSSSFPPGLPRSEAASLTTLPRGPQCPCTNPVPSPAARAAHTLGGRESGRRWCG